MLSRPRLSSRALSVATVGSGPVLTLHGSDSKAVDSAGAFGTLNVALVAQLSSDEGHIRALMERDPWLKQALERSGDADDSLVEQIVADHHETLARSIQWLFRNGHGGRTTLSNPLGATLWSVASQVRFLRALATGCLLDGEDGRYLIALMRRETLANGQHASLIDGSGRDQDGSWVARQAGVVPVGGGLVAIGIVARDPNQTRAAQRLDAVKGWLISHLRPITENPKPSSRLVRVPAGAGCAASTTPSP
jgi:hypothetical protein